MKYKKFDKETIIAEYQKGSTLQAVGKKFGISRQRVHQILLEKKIERRNSRNISKIVFSVDEETLNDLYVTQNIPVTRIAKMFSTSIPNIKYYLRKYNIPILKLWEQKLVRSRFGYNEAEFIKLYVKKNYKPKDLAEKYGVSTYIIEKMIDKLNIRK
jgi:hypothetical protein